NLNTRHFGEGEDRVALPVERCHPLPVEADRLLEGPAGGLDDAPLDLHLQSLRVDDLTGISGGNHAVDADPPGLAIDSDIGNAGHVAGEVLVPGKAEAAAVHAVAPESGAPAGLRGG